MNAQSNTYVAGLSNKPESATADIGKRFREGKLVGVKIGRVGPNNWNETRIFEPVESTADKVSKLLNDAGIKHTLTVDGEIASVEFVDSYV